MSKKKANPWPARLKALRDKLGERAGRKVTQAEIAEMIGVTTRTYISWENAQRVPGRLTLRLLKAAFPDLKID